MGGSDKKGNDKMEEKYSTLKLKFQAAGSVVKCDIVMKFLSDIDLYEYENRLRSQEEILKTFIQDVRLIISLLEEKQHSCYFELIRMFLPFSQGVLLGLSTVLTDDVLSRRLDDDRK